MRINNMPPRINPPHVNNINNTANPNAARNKSALSVFQAQDSEQQNKGVSILISKAGRVFYALSVKNSERQQNQDPMNPGFMFAAGIEAMQKAQGCTTCANRKYVDQSNDPSVSFQSPTNLRPEEAAAAVASHESEHIRNERENAENSGREVVSQSVSLQTAICPECKRVYIAGGKAETLTVPGDKPRRTPLNWAEGLIDTLMK